MGLGHRVYRVKDPRAEVLQAWRPTCSVAMAQRLLTLPIDGAGAAQRLGARNLPQCRFLQRSCVRKLGIEVDLYTPLRHCSRFGLDDLAEQLEDNQIYRPTQMYVGHSDAAYVPMDER